MSQTPEFAPSYVSVVNEFPEDLYDAMRTFVRTHPHWDQYRLMQVAVAGFLFQQGSRERAVARHYLDGLFDRAGAAPQPAAPVRPAAEAQPRSVVDEGIPAPAERRLERVLPTPEASTPLRHPPSSAASGAQLIALRPGEQALTHHSATSHLSRRIA